jgi:two-component system, cell cycle response regulator DivK
LNHPKQHLFLSELTIVTDRPPAQVYLGRGDLERSEVTATILLAEDHRDSREAMRALLEAHGYRVIEAANGREAVERALEERPDLVLMDIMMPEMDGFEATRVLRSQEQTRKLPIIAVTAMDGAQRLSQQAGVDDFVAKPIDTRGLMAKIRNWLAGREPDPATN